jgi:hypothetical protein
MAGTGGAASILMVSSQDAFWVPAIPFMMLALLITKLVWIIR